MTIYQAQEKFSRYLLDKKIDSAILDAEVLIGFVLKKPREYLLAHPEATINSKQFSRIAGLIKKRGRHQPVAQLTGLKEFFGYEFKITKAVLIPRPETEMVVAEALSLIKKNPAKTWRIVDVGSGSGAIIIALARKLGEQKLDMMATEISLPALKLAMKNALANKVSGQIKFFKGDLLAPIKGEANLILANLPYLSFKEYYNSPFYNEIKWEPKIALTDEKDGLETFRRLFTQAPKYFKRGDIILEIGFNQAIAVTKLAKQAYPHAKVKIKKDHCGFDRVLLVQANSQFPIPNS